MDATSFRTRYAEPTPVYYTVARCDNTLHITLQSAPKAQTAHRRKADNTLYATGRRDNTLHGAPKARTIR